MELEELKHHLNQRVESPQEHSTADIAALLENESRSVIQKIKRSLAIELILTTIFTIGCLISVVLIDRWSYDIFFSSFAIVGVIVSLVLCGLLWKTNKLSGTVFTVRKNLEEIISIISLYTRLYMRIGMALLPVSFALACWLSYNDPTVTPKQLSWDMLIYLLAGFVLFSLGSFWFTRWYLKKLYSNYLLQLRHLLKELDED
jgi:hypothetical protein